jgi:hypothetical protein
MTRYRLSDVNCKRPRSGGMKRTTLVMMAALLLGAGGPAQAETPLTELMICSSPSPLDIMACKEVMRRNYAAIDKMRREDVDFAICEDRTNRAVAQEGVNLLLADRMVLIGNCQALRKIVHHEWGLPTAQQLDSPITSQPPP